MMNGEVGFNDDPLHYYNYNDDCVDCDGSLCSLSSLVSSDFNFKNDIHNNDNVLVEDIRTSVSNIDNNNNNIQDPVVGMDDDDETFTRLLLTSTKGCSQQQQQYRHRHRQQHHYFTGPLSGGVESQRSINTEMTIIASTSPEIKALGSFPIVTPNSNYNVTTSNNFPNEINTNTTTTSSAATTTFQNQESWYHRRQDSFDSLCSVYSSSSGDDYDDDYSVASIVLEDRYTNTAAFHSPMRIVSTENRSGEYDDEQGQAGLQQPNNNSTVVTPNDERHVQVVEELTATSFMEEEEAEALCVVLNRQSLTSDEGITPTTSIPT
jgi:hypothetical protein